MSPRLKAVNYGEIESPTEEEFVLKAQPELAKIQLTFRASSRHGRNTAQLQSHTDGDEELQNTWF